MERASSALTQMPGGWMTYRQDLPEERRVRDYMELGHHKTAS